MREGPIRPFGEGLGAGAIFSEPDCAAHLEERSSGPAKAATAELSEKCPPPDYAFTPVVTPLFASVSARQTLPKITTIVAPPGYGKTVFLSELYKKYRRDGLTCHWINLDDRDSSVASLLRLFETEIGVGARDSSFGALFQS